MTEKKTTGSTRKTAAKKPATPRKPRQPKATSKFIRNLRPTASHFRLETMISEKEFRVQLAPRGYRGDWKEVPLAYTEDPRYGRNLGLMYEEIPKTTAMEITYDQALGYQGGYTEKVTVLRQEDVTVASGPDDTTGKKRILVQPVGPKYVNAPGSDQAVVAQMNATQAGEGTAQPFSHAHGQTRFHEVAGITQKGEALPPEGSEFSNPTKVTVERMKKS